MALSPQSIIGGIGTLLLVYNSFFAHWILKEEITKYSTAGVFIVVLGVVMLIVFSPRPNEIGLTNNMILYFFSRTPFMIFIFIVFGAIIFSTIYVEYFQNDQKHKNLETLRGKLTGFVRKIENKNS